MTTTICSFCRTEFKASASGAKCPMCGRRAAPHAGAGKTFSTVKLFFAAAMFLASGIFSITALDIFGRNQKSELLVVSVASVKAANGGYIVRGNIRNFSDTTYSVPDMVFVLKTESGIVLNRVTELPPSGLLEPMSDMEFIRLVAPRIEGAAKISVEFAREE